MLTAVVLVTVCLPAFAPAPVFRKPTATGSLGEIHMKKATMAVTSGGQERIFKMARDAKFTFNGVQGYSYDDLNEIAPYHKPMVTLTFEKGVATSVDVTLTFQGGDDLWRPGMGRTQIIIRETHEHLRAAEARMLQGR